MGTTCFILLALCLTQQQPTDAAQSRLEKVGPYSVLHLYGDDVEKGRMHGHYLRDEIKATVTDIFNDLMPNHPKTTKDTLVDRRQQVRMDRPSRYSAELVGIAQTTSVAPTTIELANSALLGLSGGSLASFGPRTAGGHLLHGQWAALAAPAKTAPAFGGSPVVIVYHPSPADGPDAQAYASVTWPGLISCWAGMNESGIAVTAQAAAACRIPAGGSVPAEYMAREILRRAKSLSQAVEIARASPRHGAATLIVSDGKIPDARALEFVGDTMAVFGPADSAENRAPFHPLASAVRRAHQFVAPELAKLQALAPAAEEGDAGAKQSTAAYAALSSIATANGLDAIAMRRLLVAKAPAPGWGRVFNPTTLDFWLFRVGSGNATAKPQRFNLRQLLAGAPAEGMPLDPASSGKASPQRADDPGMPEIYRLNGESFAYEMEPQLVANGILITKVRFPSPLETPHLENNTVYGELFRPFGKGPFPCVFVLHIAGGDFQMSRFSATQLAQNGVAALFVKLPYYGERRPVGGKVRMLSNNLERGIASMRQAILDLRRACDWIETQPDLDGKRIGMMGVSLGAIVGALAAAIEPRITHTCLIMGGGAIQHILYESSEREAKDYCARWQAAGGTRASFGKLIAPYDPASYGDRLRQRRVLMITASEDEVIPRQSVVALWEATGKQRMVWFPCGHYTMALNFFSALRETCAFFRQWPTTPLPPGPPLPPPPARTNDPPRKPSLGDFFK